MAGLEQGNVVAVVGNPLVNVVWHKQYSEIARYHYLVAAQIVVVLDLQGKLDDFICDQVLRRTLQLDLDHWTPAPTRPEVAFRLKRYVDAVVIDPEVATVKPRVRRESTHISVLELLLLLSWVHVSVKCSLG